MGSRLVGIVAVAAALVCYGNGTVAGRAAGTPPRHLVYTFTFGTESDLEVHSSGVNAGGAASGGSGVSDFSGGVGDQGTIVVDLLSQQPDNGLILKVSEQAQKSRSEGVATCVVYPTTGVICDPNVPVNPEEMALIRLLAPTFVDPNKIDANRHWKIQTANAQYSLTSDFTISHNASGVMTIDETRIVKQQQPSIVTTDVNAKIGYDFNRTIPTTVNEYSIERSQAGMDQYNTVKTQTVLQLQSDSLASQH